MNLEAVNIIKETINRLVILAETERLYTQNTGDSMMKITAQARLEAYEKAIYILNATLLQG